MTYFTKMVIFSHSYLYLCNFNLPYSDIQLLARAASCFKVKEDLDLKEAFGFCGLINFRETAPPQQLMNKIRSSDSPLKVSERKKLSDAFSAME